MPSKKIGGVRRAIRALQEVPIVLSIFVMISYTADFFGSADCQYLCPMFGFSAYIVIRLYLVSRRLYVSRWSRMLYIVLFAVVMFDTADCVFRVSDHVIEIQQYVFAIFIIGVFSSLITFMYDKWKFGF